MKSWTLKVTSFLVKVIHVSLVLTFFIFILKGPATKYFSGKTKFEVKEVEDLHAPFPMLALCKLPGYKSKFRPFREINEANQVMCRLCMLMNDLIWST